jgi:hypothetical protein
VDILMTVTLDEVSIIGAIAGIMLGVMMSTYVDVYPVVAFWGQNFALWTGIGLIFIVLSKPRISFLLLNWGQAAITLGLGFLGVAATAIAQIAVVSAGGLFLAPTSIPLDLQGVYLMEAAISETYLYFGLASFLSTWFHPIVGFFVPPAFAFFTHQYVYGSNPVVVWAVVASFAVQSLIFILSDFRLSVPLGTHIVVNLPK